MESPFHFGYLERDCPVNKSAGGAIQDCSTAVRFFLIVLRTMRWVICGNEESDQGRRPSATAKPKVAEPPKYACILHNDDYTTMEFVIEVLPEALSQISGTRLYRLCFVSITPGAEVAGVYGLEIAETKAAQAEELARSRGFPLKCTVEPA